MKLKPIKIGYITVTPKMTLYLILALFILGIGIGATIASNGNSKFALVICSMISIMITIFTFLKSEKL